MRTCLILEQKVLCVGCATHIGHHPYLAPMVWHSGILEAHGFHFSVFKISFLICESWIYFLHMCLVVLLWDFGTTLMSFWMTIWYHLVSCFGFLLTIWNMFTAFDGFVRHFGTTVVSCGFDCFFFVWVAVVCFQEENILDAFLIAFWCHFSGLLLALWCIFVFYCYGNCVFFSKNM